MMNHSDGRIPRPRDELERLAAEVGHSGLSDDRLVHLRSFLNDAESTVRFACLRFIANSGQDFSSLVRDVIERLDDDDDFVRSIAVRALEKIVDPHVAAELLSAREDSSR